ncbi:hypothetical protein TNIN_119611 [Trichonephila inaurata madagascariensis]|uniref:Uncharacterized protein n=1 Tax=Trichonephila inaurata madagascariensis TaxID=2747483 RepID=A0A8X6WZL6_9ARAC|nr:hypothetical protein TNIN_119611 [Trichonephila inaurata madagascariensis]
MIREDKGVTLYDIANALNIPQDSVNSIVLWSSIALYDGMQIFRRLIVCDGPGKCLFGAFFFSFRSFGTTHRLHIFVKLNWSGAILLKDIQCTCNIMKRSYCLHKSWDRRQPR